MYCHGTIGDVQHVADYFHIAVSMGPETAGRFTMSSPMTRDAKLNRFGIMIICKGKGVPGIRAAMGPARVVIPACLILL
jgi:hypothetical protein